MQFLMSTGVFIAENYATPSGICRAITQKLVHRVEIIVTALVFSWLSHVDGWTGMLGMHELISISFVKCFLIIRIDFYFIILIIFLFMGIPMCPLRFLLLLGCQYFLVEVLFI